MGLAVSVLSFPW